MLVGAAAEQLRRVGDIIFGQAARDRARRPLNADEIAAHEAAIDAGRPRREQAAAERDRQPTADIEDGKAR